MSAGRMTRPGEDSAARDTVLSSSRMLPGQWYCIRRSAASFAKLLPSRGRPLAAQYRPRKRWARTGMSLERSRNDGSRIENAFTR